MGERTWKDNAAEFGALTKQGKDVRLALLAACSVERDEGSGKRSVRNTSGKVSARKFAKQAETGVNRVLRHLDAWDALAERGLVKAASELTPDDVTLKVSAEAIETFPDVFDGNGHESAPARPRASEIARALEDPKVAQEVTAKASAKALGNVDVAAASETHIRRRKEEGKEPPADAASRKLGGVGPQETADRIHDESMEPMIDRVFNALESAKFRWERHGFRLALTDVEEFPELDERVQKIGALYAELLDHYDAAKAVKEQNEREGAKP